MKVFRNKLIISNDGGGLEGLKARMVELFNTAKGIQDLADTESRALTEEEDTAIAAALDEHDTIAADYDRRARLEAVAGAQSQGTGRKTEGGAMRAAGGRFSGGTPAGVPNGQRGFHNFGDFAVAVAAGSQAGVQPDNRLIANAPTSYGSEGVGPDGGYAVPPDFRRDIVALVEDSESLLGRSDLLESSSNNFVIPSDETTPWGSSGVRAFWDGEGDQLTQSKPSLGNVNVRLHKLTALVGVTEELLEDAPALDTYLRRKAPSKIDFAVSRAIIAGTGSGQPLGIMNSPGVVSIAKESGQAADTFVYLNIVKMWARCYAPSRTRAIWLINQDVEPQLLTVNTSGDSSPAYQPAGGLSASPFATIMGRPVIPHESMETLGDKGDVLLADMSSYMAIRRSGGIRADVSMHLWFDYDMAAFRFTFRVGGQPWWSAPITPRSGSSNTLSPFVTLDERA